MEILSPGFDSKERLSNELFKRLSELIYSECGIKMPPAKKTMLEARLTKRLKVLGMTDFAEYGRYLFSPQGMDSELVPMIDVVTTNKTDFFREPQHFHYLVNTAIPDLMQTTGAGHRRDLMIWSAACSSGEEPYTLAMVLEEVALRIPGFSYLILATDISTRMLDAAHRAIYNEERIEPVPMELRHKYLLRSKDPANKNVRICPKIRERVRFRRLNFLDEDFGFREHMDIIFCRNVLIYFDRPTQEMVLMHLCKHLCKGGYLFTGHSETLSGMHLPLDSMANTVSRRR
jgi:chemotaxis protein methyltransferase CheR